MLGPSRAAPGPSGKVGCGIGEEVLLLNSTTTSSLLGAARSRSDTNNSGIGSRRRRTIFLMVKKALAGERGQLEQKTGCKVRPSSLGAPRDGALGFDPGARQGRTERE